MFPDHAAAIVAFDVPSAVEFDQALAGARAAMARLGQPQTLVLTDVFGATPCNVAQKVVDGVNTRLIAGANLPMLLRAVTYCDEPMDSLVARAMAGGTQGVMQVSTVAPQNQAKKKNDQDHGDDQ